MNNSDRLANEKAFFWGIFAPIAVFVLSLKTWRIISRDGFEDLWALVHLLRSDLFFLLAFLAFGLLLVNLSRGFAGKIILIPLQIFSIAWAITEAIAHQFYMETGSTFDLNLLLFSFAKLEETASVVSGEIPLRLTIFLSQVIFVLMIFPWRIGRDSKDAGVGAGSSWKGRFAAGAAGSIFAGLSVMPVSGEDYPAFARSNMLNLAVSLQEKDELEIELAERSPLLNSQLIEKENSGRNLGKKNLVIVILESTRAISTTLYDPDLMTTPFLSSLAASSTVAERAYAIVPHTSKALVAILCGLEPNLTMPITEAQPGGIPSRCLPDLLSDKGYRSVFLQSATKHFEDREGLVQNMGYKDFIPLQAMNDDGFELANYFGPEDAVMLEPSRNWLSENSPKGPFMATYLTVTPHHNYLAPKNRYGRHHFAADDELNRYLNAIYYVDQFSRQLVEQYKELGLYENTVFVFVGDHGEAFREHGRKQHNDIMWEEGVLVPLLIHDGSNPKHHKITHLVSQLDLMPTLMDWLGYKIEGANPPGRLMWDRDGNRTLYANCWYDRRCMAAIGERYKLIEHFGKKQLEVYDLVNDPKEKNNLIKEKSDEALQKQRAQLFGWRQAVNSLYKNNNAQVARTESTIIE